jgi:hypothetical protein
MKFVFSLIIMMLLITSSYAAKFKNCSDIKKLSKEYLTCKTENFKKGAGEKLTKNGNPLKGIIEYQKKAWSKKN